MFFENVFYFMMKYKNTIKIKRLVKCYFDYHKDDVLANPQTILGTSIICSPRVP